MKRTTLTRLLAIVALLGLAAPQGGCLWYMMGKSAGEKRAAQADARASAAEAKLERERRERAEAQLERQGGRALEGAG